MRRYDRAGYSVYNSEWFALATSSSFKGGSGSGATPFDATVTNRFYMIKDRKTGLDATGQVTVTDTVYDASSNATVIEVRAPDKIGILHRITKALGELGLDIRHAKIQTMGNEVVDTFYVRNADRRPQGASTITMQVARNFFKDFDKNRT